MLTGAEPSAVWLVTLRMMPVEIGSGMFSSPIIVSVTVPLHASVSVVLAACAVTDPTVIVTMER